MMKWQKKKERDLRSIGSPFPHPDQMTTKAWLAQSQGPATPSRSLNMGSNNPNISAMMYCLLECISGRWITNGAAKTPTGTLIWNLCYKGWLKALNPILYFKHEMCSINFLF